MKGTWKAKYQRASVAGIPYIETFSKAFVNPEDSDLQSLRLLVRDLAARVERLERRIVVGETTPAERVENRDVKEIPVVSTPTAPLHASPPLLVPRVPLERDPHTSDDRPEIDLENRIGSHWLNRIGISAVLIGMSYFLKFAFDNNWIGPSGRVSIGLLSGIAVVVWSESFRRRSYKVFSYSLKAVGVGILYLSLWAAFQLYGLIPSGIAFAAMVIVTASTGVLAVKQDAEILAAIALTGGFCTPLLLSTGQNRELELFSYVTVLCTASVALVWLKPWRRLLLLSYAGMLMLYVGWYAEYYRRSEFGATFVFAAIFFTIFAVAPLVAKAPSGAGFLLHLLAALILFNTGVFFLQGYAMLNEIDKTAAAWFALALAAVHIGLDRIISRLEVDDRELLRMLHLALAVALVTIAVPIRLDGHWITVGWLVESGVLLWVADRSGARFLHYLAAVALVLGVVRLLVVDDFAVETVLFNERMGTYALAMAVLVLLAFYSRRRQSDFDNQLAAVAIMSVNVLALVGLSREIADYYAGQMGADRYGTQHWSPSDAARHQLMISENFTYSALWMGYGALLMVIGFWRKSAFFRWQALFLIAATIVKVFIYDVWQLDRGYRVLSFMILGVLLLGVSFVYQKDWLKFSEQRRKKGSESR